MLRRHFACSNCLIEPSGPSNCEMHTSARSVGGNHQLLFLKKNSCLTVFFFFESTAVLARLCLCKWWLSHNKRWRVGWVNKPLARWAEIACRGVAGGKNVDESAYTSLFTGRHLTHRCCWRACELVDQWAVARLSLWVNVMTYMACFDYFFQQENK